MSIKVGDKIPSVKLQHMNNGSVETIDSVELFSAKKVALFALPGAYTPTCSASHLPGYICAADELKAKGIDLIICLSVNDAFVMSHWGEDQKVGDKVMMIADGSANFTKAIGLELDLDAHGMGLRSQRFAMVVDDAKVITLNIEAPGKFDVSDAKTILATL